MVSIQTHQSSNKWEFPHYFAKTGGHFVAWLAPNSVWPAPWRSLCYSLARFSTIYRQTLTPHQWKSVPQMFISHRCYVHIKRRCTVILEQNTWRMCDMSRELSVSVQADKCCPINPVLIFHMIYCSGRIAFCLCNTFYCPFSTLLITTTLLKGKMRG